jgi:excisionase family DNA binding protein
MKNDELMTLKEVMDYLKISRSTVFRLMDAGKLTSIKLGYRTIRFKRSEVEALIDSTSR